jgi:hypothetical protein
MHTHSLMPARALSAIRTHQQRITAQRPTWRRARRTAVCTPGLSSGLKAFNVQAALATGGLGVSGVEPACGLPYPTPDVRGVPWTHAASRVPRPPSRPTPSHQASPQAFRRAPVAALGVQGHFCLPSVGGTDTARDFCRSSTLAFCNEKLALTLVHTGWHTNTQQTHNHFQKRETVNGTTPAAVPCR